MIDKIVTANGEHKSLGKAQKMLRKLAEISVSVPLIEDYTREIGDELSGLSLIHISEPTRPY